MGEVLNREELMARVDNDLELLGELIELYREDAPELLEQVRKAIEEHHGPNLKHYAHTLKGAVGNFCAQRAYELAYKLEKAGAGNDFSTAAQDYQALVEELQRVEQALDGLASECAAGSSV